MKECVQHTKPCEQRGTEIVRFRAPGWLWVEVVKLACNDWA